MILYHFIAHFPGGRFLAIENQREKAQIFQHFAQYLTRSGGSTPPFAAQ
jgi:hypothetical protein